MGNIHKQSIMEKIGWFLVGLPVLFTNPKKYFTVVLKSKGTNKDT